MSRRITEKQQNQAKKLQREIDDLVGRRGHLLSAASNAKDFKEKADSWKVVHEIELQIERRARRIRKLLTPHSVPNPQPLLWDFIQPDEPKSSKRKGGR